MTRRCNSCHRQLPLRDFDLNGERLKLTCRLCTPRPQSPAPLEEGTCAPLSVRIVALKRKRQSLIAELVQVDAGIAGLRLVNAQIAQIVHQLDELEKRRRSRIVALVKIDAEIAELRAIAAPPQLVVDENPIVDATFGDDEDVDGRLSDEV